MIITVESMNMILPALALLPEDTENACPSARMLLWPVGALGFHDTQSREEMGLGLGRNFIIGDA